MIGFIENLTLDHEKMMQLRITQSDYYLLKSHLFSGDGLETVALALCGRMKSDDSEFYTVNKIIPIPCDVTERKDHSIKWNGEIVEDEIKQAMAENLVILKIHSHPDGLAYFSSQDDESDLSFYNSIFGWGQSTDGHISAFMQPDGMIVARKLNEGISFTNLDKVSIVGDTIQHFVHPDNSTLEIDKEIHIRNIQAFGDHTMSLLKGMSVAVVGCSGTGSPLIEQLVRLGVGEIVLVDFDKVEFKNLNRILNSSILDAKSQRLKVDVIADRINWMGLGTVVKTIPENICSSRQAIKTIASTDFIFGCSDSAECRDILNRISTFYLVPYLDLGVVLIPNLSGGISKIAGAVHYIQPKGSSLLSRGVYSLEEVDEEVMKRQNNDQYEQLKNEGYLRGLTTEESPAVISINMYASSIAVNEFLNRVHPYKSMDLFETQAIRFSISDNITEYDAGGSKDEILWPLAGLGDREIFIGLIGL